MGYNMRHVLTRLRGLYWMAQDVVDLFRPTDIWAEWDDEVAKHEAARRALVEHEAEHEVHEGRE